MFFFRRIKDQTLSVPVTNYVIKDNSWNCIWEKKKTTSATSDKANNIVTIDIIPNLINIGKSTASESGNPAVGGGDEMRRWFIVVWAEYSGRDAYPEKISKLEMSCAELKVPASFFVPTSSKLKIFALDFLFKKLSSLPFFFSYSSELRSSSKCSKKNFLKKKKKPMKSIKNLKNIKIASNNFIMTFKF